MNRNEIKKAIEKILNDQNLSEEQKKSKIVELCYKEEQGFGGMPLRKLLKQIEKEYNITLDEPHLLNEIGGIAKKGDVIYDNSDIDINRDNDNGDDLPPNAPMPSPVS